MTAPTCPRCTGLVLSDRSEPWCLKCGPITTPPPPEQASRLRADVQVANHSEELITKQLTRESPRPPRAATNTASPAMEAGRSTKETRMPTPTLPQRIIDRFLASPQAKEIADEIAAETIAERKAVRQRMAARDKAHAVDLPQLDKALAEAPAAIAPARIALRDALRKVHAAKIARRDALQGHIRAQNADKAFLARTAAPVVTAALANARELATSARDLPTRWAWQLAVQELEPLLAEDDNLAPRVAEVHARVQPRTAWRQAMVDIDSAGPEIAMLFGGNAAQVREMFTEARAALLGIDPLAKDAPKRITAAMTKVQPILQRMSRAGNARP